jgi:transcriptional antiterminator NusG
MADFEGIQPEDVDPSEKEMQDNAELSVEDASDVTENGQVIEEDIPQAEMSQNKERSEIELAMENILDQSVDARAVEARSTENEDDKLEDQVGLDQIEDEESSLAVGPEEEPDDGRRWYVVHCYSGYENKVRHNLEQRIETMGMKDRIFDVVVPTEEEIEVKEGKRRTIERRVFPGYILVQMIMTEESWYVVRNTPGVTGFVGMGNEPTPLRPEEVTSIIKRMEAEAPRIKVTYKIGQKVRIIDGPFNDFIGTVDDIDMERAKVRVMVSFFGRETPVELDFLQVEKA